MIIQARFGAAQTGLGYQFYNASGVLIAPRVTGSSIIALEEVGAYLADATVPGGAVGVYWNSTVSLAQATEDLREALASPAVPSAAAIADEVRVELATELARIDTTISSRNATAPDNTAVLAAIAALPTEAEIIAAAGGITVETAAKLDAADQILLVALHTPSETPSLVVPSPDADSSMSVVFAYTENIINEQRAGIVFSFQLIHTPAKSERLLEIAPKTAVTDAEGLASISLIRGLRYRVSCPELGLDKPFTPTGATFNLLTL